MEAPAERLWAPWISSIHEKVLSATLHGELGNLVAERLVDQEHSAFSPSFPKYFQRAVVGIKILCSQLDELTDPQANAKQDEHGQAEIGSVVPITIS